MNECRSLFWACPSLRSGRATPHYANASVLRCAPHCLTACSVSLTQRHFDVLYDFYTDYQILTRSEFFILFALRVFYFASY
ncbi:MAG: hypothetical protein NZ455_07535 [Bacteroidia bacterium]|nr:hypothetical protein [Bacteroidia bacterium]MDW8346416.1 hypothetical protein [Bacteroidia bacterium]